MNAVLLTSRAIPLSANSKLRVEFWSYLIGPQTAVIRIQQLLQDGTPVETSNAITIDAAAQNQAFTYPLTDGFLISVTVYITGSDVSYGTLYCRIIQYNGDVSSITRYETLACGILSAGSTMRFPDNPPEPSSILPNVYSQIVGEGPAPGSEAAITLPEYQLFEIQGGGVTLQTSATIAVRTLTITFNPLQSQAFVAVSRTTQTASQIREYFFWCGAGIPADGANSFYIQLPEHFKTQGLELTTSTANIQAGDTFGPPNIVGNAAMLIS